PVWTAIFAVFWFSETMASGQVFDKIKPGDVLKIPIKKEKVERVEIRTVDKVAERQKVDSALLFKKKNEYKIVLLMPLNLDGESTQSTAISDMAAEFYMGAKLAIDKLEEEGLKAKILIFDSKNDSSSVEEILKKKEIQNADILIGPFFGNTASLVADWCKERSVRMICPFSTNYEIVEGNPFVYEAVASDVTLAEGLASYLVKTKTTERIVVVKSKSDDDLAMYNAFRKSFTRDPKALNTKLIEADLDNFQTFISGKTKLVFLSNNKAATRTFFNNLNKASSKIDNENLFVYATKDAANLDDLPTKNKSKINLHYIAPHDFYYEKPEIKEIHKEYRKLYNSDMSKMAVQGYDLLLYTGEVMLLQKKEKGLLMNHFNFIEKGRGNGFENQNGYLFKFQDYEIITVGNLYE
ncbi:MAG: ABC transporter substrate-binding protein, partial [Bacteroidetes bacterium]|nr:ABC transporter substrate-binding protein [Bacteroidota bacterium]